MSVKHRQYSICILLFLCQAGLMSDVSGQQYIRTEFTIVNGLGQGDVNYITEDSFGYVWITQQNGVTRFNGNEFKSIPVNPADPGMLHTSEVHHIHHLPDGNAWFATFKGLSFYNRDLDQFTTYDTKNGLHHNSVMQAFPFGDSIVFAATFYGYDRIDLRTNKITWLRPFPEVPDSVYGHRSPNFVTHPKINPYRPDELYSIHLNNLYALDTRELQFKQLTHFRFPSDPLYPGCYYLLDYEWIDSNQLLLNLFPNKGNLYLYNLSRAEMKQVPVFPGYSIWLRKMVNANGHVTCLEETSGIFTLHPGDWKVERIDSSLQNRAYNTFLEDSDGNIWVGEHGYVYRYQPTEVITYYGEDPSVYLFHVADPTTGTILVYGYDQSTPLVFRNKRFERLSFPGNEPMSGNTFFHPDLHQFINLTGGYERIFHPYYNTDARVPIRDFPKGFAVNDFAPVPGGFYFAVLNRIFLMDFKGNVQLIHTADKDIDHIEYADQHLYYSCFGFVYMLDLKDKTTREIFRLGKEYVINLGMTGDRLWIGWLHDLFYMDVKNPAYTVVDTRLGEKFPDLSLHQISCSGPSVLLPASYMMIEMQATTLQVIKTYSYLDNIYMGYWDDEVTHTPDGYFITTDNKKIIAFPEKMSPPRLHSYRLEEIEINGVRLHEHTGTILLSAEQNDILILSDAVYSGPEKNLVYQFRNIRKSGEWMAAKNNVLQLLDQKPGKYTIDLRVSDGTGQERVIAHAFDFEIRPPWYQHPVFYVSVVFALVGGLLLAYRYRIRTLRFRYDMQSRLQQLEVSALKAQMNPHFIFNCLNSIKALILIGDTDMAVTYIGTFSKLVRSSLDNVDEKLISLKDELDIADNYLSLERLRFGDRLTWSVRVLEDALLTEVRLPPFILQPLIENAIVHGIKHIRQEGFIHLLVYREGKVIKIKVIDNGTGLEASKTREAHKEHSTRKHLGISLVERRLKSIGASLALYDHVDASNRVTGTISEITIPIQHE